MAVRAGYRPARVGGRSSGGGTRNEASYRLTPRTASDAPASDTATTITVWAPRPR